MRYITLITFILFSINSFSQLNASIQSFQDVSCLGPCDGSATVLATGGTPPYTYSWNSVPVQTTATATGLCVGNYIVTVTDALSATDTASVSIIQQLVLNVNMTVTQDDTCNTCTGAANVVASGGTPPYMYFWTNGDTTQTTTTLCGGYGDVFVIDALSCFGWDTATVNIIATPSCPQFQTGLISGTVFNDINGNCVQDTLEFGLPGVMMEANPGNYITTTNANGEYGFILPYGTYTITQVLQQYYNELCPVSGSYNVLLDSINNPTFNVDFADSISNVQDVSINCFVVGNIVPGFIASYYIHYTSMNATPTSGSIYLVVDDSLSFVSSSVAPSSISGDTIFWNYSNLLQIESRFITADFQVPPNVNLLGDTMDACAHITPLLGDVAPANNTSCFESVVVGSYDPNDKRVEPAGVGPNGDILLSETELKYYIRFQNSGTLYATNVAVKDTLSPNLDIASLRNVTATHPFTYTVTSQGVITFSFNNIMLPDSGTNEPGSHGAIQFTIDQKATNTIGTVIENTAHIYFDFNPAIVTNTVVNTIVAITDVHEMVKADQNANIYPNPTSTILYIDTDLNVKVVNIIDLTGKLVKTIAPENNTINVAELSNGIYFLQLIGDDKTITQKFVKN